MKFGEMFDSIAKRVKFNFEQNSPKIYFAIGVVAFGATVYSAVKAAKKWDETTKDAKEKLEIVHQKREDHSEEAYPQKEYSKDLVKTYTSIGTSYAKLLWMPTVWAGIALGGFGLSYRTLSEWNVESTMAYAALSKAYAELKEKSENQTEVIKKEVEDKKSEPAEEVKKATAPSHGPWCLLINKDTCDCWHTRENGKADIEYYAMWLWRIQCQLNDDLKRDGFMYGSDICRKLGIKKIPHLYRTLGYIYNNDHKSVIDFGIFRNNTQILLETAYDPETDGIIVDFNFDGNIQQMMWADKYGSGYDYRDELNYPGGYSYGV